MTTLEEQVISMCEEKGPLQYGEIISQLDGVEIYELGDIPAELADHGRLTLTADGYDVT